MTEQTQEPNSNKCLTFLKYGFYAMVISTLIIAIGILALDNPTLNIKPNHWHLNVDEYRLGMGNITVIKALTVGAVLSILPIFLFLLFISLGTLISLIIGGVLIFVAITLALHGVFFILPLVIIAGIIWYCQRSKKQA